MLALSLKIPHITAKEHSHILLNEKYIHFPHSSPGLHVLHLQVAELLDQEWIWAQCLFLLYLMLSGLASTGPSKSTSVQRSLTQTWKNSGKRTLGAMCHPVLKQMGPLMSRVCRHLVKQELLTHGEPQKECV